MTLRDMFLNIFLFFFSSRRRHTRYWRDWSSDVCSSDLRGRDDVDVGRDLEDGVGRRVDDRCAGAQVLGAEALEHLEAVGGLVAEEVAAPRQIGSASCRERV